MSKIPHFLRANLPYTFVAVGVVWLVVVFSTGSLLTLWPVVTFFLSGLLLKTRPGQRLTWAWVMATCVMGALLAGYQTAVAAPLLSGSFSFIATGSALGFGVFAVLHLVLLYLESSLE
jgi:hypothetical protein